MTTSPDRSRFVASVRVVCGRGTMCPWMTEAASKGTVFQWQASRIDGSRFLVVKVSGLEPRMVAACPVCGGRLDGGSW